MKNKIIALTLAITLIMSLNSPVFASGDGDVLNALTKICLAYPGHTNGGLLPVYVTSPDFTPVDGTGVELESSLDTALYSDTVKFHYGSAVTGTYEITDLAAYGSGDIISLIIYGGKVYRIKGDSLAGRIGMVFDYTVKYYRDSTASAPFHADTGRGFMGDYIPHNEALNIPDGYTSDFEISGQTTISGITAGNVLNVIYTTKRSNLSYRVNYLGSDGQTLRQPKDVSEAVYGSSYTEEAVAIAGYIPDEESKSVTISTSSNAISFIYSKATNLSYQVEYLDQSGTELLPLKAVNNLTFGNTYSEAAPEVTGYSPDAGNKSIVVTAGENKIVFHYNLRNDFSYTVSYKGPNNTDLLASKTVTGVTYGSICMETATAITGYSPDVASKSVTIGEGVNQIVFNYTVNQTQQFGYTVRYYKDSVAGTLLRTDTGSGVLGATIPFNATAYVPTGYTNVYTLVGQTAVIETATNNVLNVVYATPRSDLSYTVYYRDTNGNDLILPKIVNNVVFGSTYTETATVIAKWGYDSFNKSVMITTDNNIVTFIYRKCYYEGADVVSMGVSYIVYGGAMITGYEWRVNVVDFAQPSENQDIYIDMGYFTPTAESLQQAELMNIRVNGSYSYSLQYSGELTAGVYTHLIIKLKGLQARFLTNDVDLNRRNYVVRYYKGSVSGVPYYSENGSGEIGAAIPFNTYAYRPYGYSNVYTVSGQQNITSDSSNNVLNVVYTTIDPSVGIIQPKTLTISAAIGKEYAVPISWKNLKNKAVLKVTYDRTRLELQDTTAQTLLSNLTGDPESASRLDIISLANGVLSLRLKPNLGSGEMNSGDSTILKFKGLATGSTTVRVEVI
jgi:hypothetical protein